MRKHSKSKVSTAGAEQRAFLRAKPLAKQIDIHPKTLKNWARAGHISQYVIGRRTVLYDPAEVFNFIASSRVLSAHAA
jgi:hypothetical protein